MRRAAKDHRRIRLSVTEQGIAALALAQQETREQLMELESLTPEELSTVSAALMVLGGVFSQGGVDVQASCQTKRIGSIWENAQSRIEG